MSKHFLQIVIFTSLTILFLAACSQQTEVQRTPQPITLINDNNENTLPVPTPTPEATAVIVASSNSDTAVSQEVPQTTNNTTTNNQACLKRSEWPLYTVQGGDTLGQIAKAADTTVDELTKANCLTNPNQLLVGDLLHVPQLPANPAPQEEIWTTYSGSLYTFQYPNTWHNISDGAGTGFQGESGHVMIFRGSSENRDLPAEVQAQIHNQTQVKAFGSTPSVEVYSLSDGRPAQIIFPSNDQISTMPKQSLLIAPSYAFSNGFIYLYADSDHIVRIADTLSIAEQDPLPPIPEDQWAEHNSSFHQLKFIYPSDWQRTPGNEGAHLVGEDGFVIVKAISSSANLQTVAELEVRANFPSDISPELHPFFSKDGRSGIIIRPPANSSFAEAEIVMPYTNPISDGSTTYQYVTLRVDLNHLFLIEDTLTMLD